ncbi:Usp domain-containing protein [Psidium guajava]|nr:Usp domain-containing protein [Psidium guajava]
MEVGPPITAPRKVMVVADPTSESAAALQYTLSHGVVEHDELILLHVENPNSWRTTLATLFKRPSFVAAGNSQSGSSRGGSVDQNRGGDGGGDGGSEVDFLDEMKHACEVVQPNIRVRTTRVELEGNKDKASAILSQCTSHEIDVLIVGQRRSFSTAILGRRRRGGSLRGTRLTDMAEYLIENSKCTCVGVQKKGQNGGYLLNTKTYRNFWLLA